MGIWYNISMNNLLYLDTDEYIRGLAVTQGKAYTIGKSGAERYYADNGLPIYPPDFGFSGETAVLTLPAGSRVDRYGGVYGVYVSPAGTEFTARSLPRTTNKNDYHIYIVRKPLKVTAGRVTPWFGEKGGGWQYVLPDKKMVVDLIKNNTLEEVI